MNEMDVRPLKELYQLACADVTMNTFVGGANRKISDVHLRRCNRRRKTYYIGCTSNVMLASVITSTGGRELYQSQPQATSLDSHGSS